MDKSRKMAIPRRPQPLQFGFDPTAPAISRWEKLYKYEAERWSRKLSDQKVVITKSKLRMEALLANGNTQSVKWAVLSNDNSVPVRSSEIRLNPADAFRAIDIGFFMGKMLTASTPGSLNKETFPNPRVFTGGGESAALQEFYNGLFKIDQGSVNLFQMEGYEFYRAPISQQGTAVSTVATTGVVGRDSWASDDHGYTELNPSFLINGSKKYNINVSLPDSVNPSPGGDNVVVLEFRGFLIQQGATYASGMD